MTQIESKQKGFDLDSGTPYEDFTKRPFYVAVNRETLRDVQKVNSAVDCATGTGAVLELLIAMGKLTPGFKAIGIDLDESMLDKARKKFQKISGVSFVSGSIENIPFIPNGFADLVTCFNAIHLTNAENTILEGFRIVKNGGLWVANTAYEKDNAYPEGTERFWGRVVALARVTLRKEGFTTITDHPIDYQKYSETDFKRFAQDAGFIDIHTRFYAANVDREDVKAICSYPEFAEGALPGIQTEKAIEALVASVDPAFNKFEKDFGKNKVPRNWMIMTARKPE